MLFYNYLFSQNIKNKENWINSLKTPIENKEDNKQSKILKNLLANT